MLIRQKNNNVDFLKENFENMTDLYKINKLNQWIKTKEEELLVINNQKLVLKQVLIADDKTQNEICYFHGESLKKLTIFQNQQTSKFLKLKAKIIKFFTFGYYDLEKRLVNKIISEKVVLNNQKKVLKTVGSRILKTNNSLNNLEQARQQKSEEMMLLKNWHHIIIQNNPNVMYVQNETVTINQDVKTKLLYTDKLKEKINSENDAEEMLKLHYGEDIGLSSCTIL